jgi:hypothetical protein
MNFHRGAATKLLLILCLIFKPFTFDSPANMRYYTFTR